MREPETQVTRESSYDIKEQLVDSVGHCMINLWLLELVPNFLQKKESCVCCDTMEVFITNKPLSAS